ncbi:hypothetical protein [Bosea beijingensis]|uniref:hypothetical protein n=1 Tax=Bosea beijingensis TaxID=3068632 RepID=UPI002740C34F|nr:hypothetical protein [Bosea sp. REN20]
MLKLVVAFVVAAGMLLSAIHVTSSHNPLVLAQAEAERHTALGVEMAEYGHTHLDGEEAERIPGHLHGHNSTDHIHDVVTVIPVPGVGHRVPVRVPLPALQEGAAHDRQHDRDRPPRPLVA